jgi:nitronate monooxygenase
LKSDAGRHTAITNVFTGRPARGIVNRFIREVGPISSDAPAFPLAFSAVFPLIAKAMENGRSDFAPMWAGQNVSGCKEVPAAQITQELGGGVASRKSDVASR